MPGYPIVICLSCDIKLNYRIELKLARLSIVTPLLFSSLRKPFWTIFYIWKAIFFVNIDFLKQMNTLDQEVHFLHD